jgi:hypothetical protein
MVCLRAVAYPHVVIDHGPGDAMANPDQSGPASDIEVVEWISIPATGRLGQAGPVGSGLAGADQANRRSRQPEGLRDHRTGPALPSPGRNGRNLLDAKLMRAVV